MDVLYVCLHQKRLKKIVSACQPWHWKICWRGENGRSDEAASILVLQLCLQLLPNENTWCLSSLETMQGNLLTFLADAPLQPSTYQRYDIRDWLKHLNPRFEIISYEYFIVHTPWNDYLELPTHTTTENSDLVHTLPECNFTIWRIYVLPSIWNTAPMNTLFHARWSDHREIIMHTNSQNLALCRLKFFFSPKAKEFKRRNEAGR